MPTFTFVYDKTWQNQLMPSNSASQKVLKSYCPIAGKIYFVKES